jgi:hypothetical protein
MQASPVSSKRLPSSFHGFNANLHYDNPMRKSGRTDKSAFRLYYTTVPRENVVGVFSPLIVSVEPGMRLKPGAYSTTHSAPWSIRRPAPRPIQDWGGRQASSGSLSQVAARCPA